MTTTEASLGRAAEIIDSYAELGLRGVFLRPISPYGFALRGRGGANYGIDRWLEFYASGLERIVELNRQGLPMVEIYASIIAKKMLTNADPGYVDLASPAGMGIGALVYNYDGDIYASDEGRMLAEMGDQTFRLGNAFDSSYADIMLSDGLLRPLTESITLSAPMCATVPLSLTAGPIQCSIMRPWGTSPAIRRCQRSATATWESSHCCSGRCVTNPTSPP